MFKHQTVGFVIWRATDDVAENEHSLVEMTLHNLFQLFLEFAGIGER